MTPERQRFLDAVVDARLNAGEADRLERLLTLGWDGMRALKTILDARSETHPGFYSHYLSG